MKFEKVRNYNHLLLAIGGTLALLFLVVSALFALANWAMYMFDNNEPIERGIMATEETNLMAKDSLRNQIISFNNIYLIDSASQTYILPVTQANLEGEESINALLNSKMSRSKYSGKETFNNLVIYESKTDKSDILFDKRIFISKYQIFERGEKQYVLIIGTDSDSNKDKYINNRDLQELHIYEVGNKQLTKVQTDDRLTTLNVFDRPRSNDILGAFGLDRNNNGLFEWGREPKMFYRIDIEHKSLVKILQDEQINQLQQLLEGS